MISRRGLLVGLATAPLAAAAPRTDALVIGDSWAFALTPRLGKAMKPKSLRLAADARGGESARNFLRRGWWRAAVERHAPRQIIACLGINAVKQERAKLAETYAALVELSRSPVLFVAPNRQGFRFDLSYMHDALREAGVDVFWCQRLPLEPGDRVHLTHDGNVRLAALLVGHLWPDAASSQDYQKNSEGTAPRRRAQAEDFRHAQRPLERAEEVDVLEGPSAGKGWSSVPISRQS